MKKITYFEIVINIGLTPAGFYKILKSEIVNALIQMICILSVWVRGRKAQILTNSPRILNMVFNHENTKAKKHEKRSFFTI